ncbi:MAG: signaling recognition particle receptor family protein, partial [Pseudomonadota bacterium]
MVGLWQRLKAGLQKSTHQLVDGIAGIFTGGKLESEQLEALEAVLLRADLGPTLTGEICDSLRSQHFGKDVDEHLVRNFLAEHLASILSPCQNPLDFSQEIDAPPPMVVLVSGVNGAGKTTTIGKLAHRYCMAGRKVMICAGDVFRAAAFEQLQIWADRAGATLHGGAQTRDAAALAYDAISAARANGHDVVIIDTAGRLHNKSNLMDELEKLVRVVRKKAPSQPQYSLLILDAGIGQNSLAQVENFQKSVPVTGLIMTKLD